MAPDCDLRLCWRVRGFNKRLRADLESVLRQGETLSEFVETTVRNAVEFRRTQTEFHARGEAAWQEYQRTGTAFPASQITHDLRDLLETKRLRLSATQNKPDNL